LKKWYFLLFILIDILMYLKILFEMTFQVIHLPFIAGKLGLSVWLLK
jgi:hypothetical protein